MKPSPDRPIDQARVNEAPQAAQPGPRETPAESLRTVYLGLGSNLGNRQANILQAQQYIRGRAEIDAVTS